MSKFIGRKKELAVLGRLLLKKNASLVVIWGRRRIGKSTLVGKFVHNKKSWSFSGFPPQEHTTKQDQINHFSQQMARNIGMPELKADNWGEIFWHLGNQAEKEKEIVLFFDEISWMGSKDPDFLGYLKNEWDSTFSRHSKLILILCGSVSTWIEENILNSTGFFGRISIKLELKELPLSDCNEFWGKQKDLISAYEKFKVLSVTGGIPKYLEEIISSETSEKNIHHLCFREEGLLYREYDQIFSDLFSGRASTFDKIIRTLADGEKNLNEIVNVLGIIKSGNISKYIHDLITAGFVSQDSPWNIQTKKKSNLMLFRIKDNYLRFYLKCIEPYVGKIHENGFFQDPTYMSSWESIMGLQFECLVLNNIERLLILLGLQVHEIERVGPFFQRKSSKHKGCQIDILIQTRFGTLYLCELKFSRSRVGKRVVETMQEKIARFSYPRGCSIRPVLIHVNGVTEEVNKREFFYRIIDFSEFLKAE